MKLRVAYTHIYDQLCSLGLETINAQQEAWWILETITGQSQPTLLINEEKDLSKEQQIALEKLLYDRIILLKPLQYSIGHVPFCSLTITVRPPTLIPRPETEEWCAELINRLSSHHQSSLRILDLCTGSGCLALALAQAFSQSFVTGIDIKKEALDLAEENQRNNALTNCVFGFSNLFADIAENFDLIITNPPYLSSDEWNELSDQVKKWEDKDAFVAQEDGIAFYEDILKKAPAYLESSILAKNGLPSLVFEINPLLIGKIEEKIAQSVFKKHEIFYDLADKPRAVFLYL